MSKIIKWAGIFAIVAIFVFSNCENGNSTNDDSKVPTGNLDFTGTISITPTTAFIGTELTAIYDGNENISVYQWKKDTTEVGANSNKYTPTEVGNYTVTISATGYNNKTSPIIKVELPVIPWDGSIDYDWFNTSDSEFLIITAEELAGFANIVNGTRGDGSSAYSFIGKTIKLGNNINLNNKPWTPIGRYDEITFWKFFNGTFDGNGKIIASLYINDSTAELQGLFGCIGTNGTIKKLGISGNVSGKSDVGGIVGYNSGTVENCYSTVDITSNSSGGGIAGSNTGTLQNCYATGNVTGSQSVGGIVGNNQSTLQNCVALNLSVTRTSGSATNIGRVIGYYVGYGRVNNYGLTDMSGSTILFIEKNSSGKDGKDVSKTEIETENWWKTTSPNGPNWNFTTIWKWDNTENLPQLR